MRNHACMICHDNKPEQIDNKIKQINYLLHDIEPNTYHNYTFNWNFNFKCKYGLRCDKANKILNTLKRDIEDINNKLVSVALDSDLKLYHEILRLLQGQFPAVYNQLLRIHNCSK